MTRHLTTFIIYFQYESYGRIYKIIYKVRKIGNLVQAISACAFLYAICATQYLSRKCHGRSLPQWQNNVLSIRGLLILYVQFSFSRSPMKFIDKLFSPSWSVRGFITERRPDRGRINDPDLWLIADCPAWRLSDSHGHDWSHSWSHTNFSIHYLVLSSIQSSSSFPELLTSHGCTRRTLSTILAPLAGLYPWRPSPLIRSFSTEPLSVGRPGLSRRQESGCALGSRLCQIVHKDRYVHNSFYNA